MRTGILSNAVGANESRSLTEIDDGLMFKLIDASGYVVDSVANDGKLASASNVNTVYGVVKLNSCSVTVLSVNANSVWKFCTAKPLLSRSDMLFTLPARSSMP